jgi:2-phospho-L-lactate guanylyltransferase
MRVLAVPVKSPSVAKSRLSPVLTRAERAALTVALLEDVLDACLANAGWETWVISPDADLRALAASHGARPVEETGHTLLAAVRQVELAAGDSAEALAILLGDLPYLTGEELDGALAADGAVVAAPASSDGGTNLLVRRPPGIIRARFGRASFDKHRWAARRAGVAMSEARGSGLERDLDRPEDLRALLASGHPCRTLSACIRMGLASRLVPDVAAATEG